MTFTTNSRTRGEGKRLEKAHKAMLSLQKLAQPLDLAHGSYFGRRRPEDGRIDWQAPAKSVHDLVRAVAPPFPGAFTDVAGLRLAILKTQLDSGARRHPEQAPCLYQVDGQWYADCADRRLKILQLAVNGEPVAQNSLPAALARQPLALS